MDKTTIALALAIPAATATPALAAPTVWDVDTSHAHAQFKVRHLMVSNVRGELGPVTGTVWLDEQDVTRSRVEVTIDARGLDTRNEKRDEHLRSPDFFDVQTHPFVTFKSTSVRKGAGGALKVAGDLTIRGVTKPIVLDVDPLPAAINDPWGNTKRGAAARATLDRKAWGLTWNAAIETGGVAVGEKVAIEIEAELVRRKDGVAKKE